MIRLSGKNLCYEVEYWVNDGIKAATLYENELVAEVPKKGMGISTEDSKRGDR